MIYQIIAVCFISATIGAKKPMYGGLAGLILAPLTHLIFYNFSSLLFFLLFPTGFCVGLVVAGGVHRLFYGSTADDKRKPYYTSIHMPGGNTGGGIVYTDEEEENARENQRRDERS